ncbi:hypothetical protein ACFPRL_33115 [Pseudoclavibacter helvolus]
MDGPDRVVVRPVRHTLEHDLALSEAHDGHTEMLRDRCDLRPAREVRLQLFESGHRCEVGHVAPLRHGIRGGCASRAWHQSTGRPSALCRPSK